MLRSTTNLYRILVLESNRFSTSMEYPDIHKLINISNHYACDKKTEKDILFTNSSTHSCKYLENYDPDSRYKENNNDIYYSSVDFS